MNPTPSSKFIKLGTSVRFLIDAKPGMPIGEKHVVPNIDSIMALLSELDFVETQQSKPIAHLKALRDELVKASATVPALTASQAARVEAEARRLRDKIFSEGERKLVQPAQRSSDLGIAVDPFDRVSVGRFFKAFTRLSLGAVLTLGGILSGVIGAAATAGRAPLKTEVARQRIEIARVQLEADTLRAILAGRLERADSVAKAVLGTRRRGEK